MKKTRLIFYTAVLLILLLVFISCRQGYGPSLSSKKEITADFTVKDNSILVRRADRWQPVEIRGVDMGTGIPGSWSTSFAGDKETYLRWFHEIQAMGANTVRIYTVNPEAFYEAFYEFNRDNAAPLYLLQGVWIDENAQNSHIDAYDPGFINAFLRDCRQAADVIHGRKRIGTDAPKNVAKGTFRRDVSPWVIGYIIGVEWEPTIVSYTNDLYSEQPGRSRYSGDYLYTTEDASPFEAMLCRVGDGLISYESRKYGEQRLLAFSNWPTTDPFEYPEEIRRNLNKYCSVDVEHIRSTEKVISGQFASYHVYPYYPCYINYMDDWSLYGIEDKKDYLIGGEIRSYQAYLHGLVLHHTMPVLISEFGVPSSRGMASQDVRQGFHQGGMSEAEQAEALVGCYREIMAAGCAGGCVFSWQDEWFKRTWNTMHAVNLRRTCYWPDYQTNEQYFGLLSFDVSAPESCCNDGDVSEWSEDDLISAENGLALYMKSDRKYLYFRISGFDPEAENGVCYIPIDVTPKSGSTVCAANGLHFSRAADFLVRIHGRSDSSLLVQERYDALRSTCSLDVYGFDSYITGNVPAKDSPEFTDIRLPLQAPVRLIYGDKEKITADSYITGALLYGNGNPESSSFCSNSDFFSRGDEIELRIPWQLLNFSDPTTGEIHDDYYEHYGVGYLNVKSIYAGASRGVPADGSVELREYRLPKFGSRPRTQERLKESYYAMQKLWSEPYRLEDIRPDTAYKTVQVTAETDIPALMYHEFRRDSSDPEDAPGEYAVYASEFEADLRFLRDNGFTALTSQEILAVKDGRAEMPEKPILLTIDDGSCSVYDIAYPLLQKYNMKAVLAIIGSGVDEESLRSRRADGNNASRPFDFCTWDELREMQRSGHVEIVSHSYGLHEFEKRQETAGSKTGAEAITDDVFRFTDTLNREQIRITPAIAYPYSLRSRASDTECFEAGYRILYTGDIYALENDLSWSFRSRHCAGNVFLIPRQARYHGNDIAYWLEQIRAGAEYVKAAGGDG